MIACVEKAGALDRCIFWSPSKKILRGLRAVSPAARLMAPRTPYANLDAAIADYGAAIVEFDAEVDDLDEIETCRARGVEAMIKYFGDDRAEMERLIRLRPDRVNIDRPDIFLAGYRTVIRSFG